MKTTILGSPSFSHIKVELEPDEFITTESGAMTSMDKGIDLRSKTNGGFLNALLLKVIGSESFFINYFKNTSKTSQTIFLSKTFPGDIVKLGLSKDENIFIQSGAFIACTQGISFKLKWAGFSSFFAREGLYRLSVSGPGSVWYGSFGAVVSREVKGSYIIDSGHLLSYTPGLKLKLKLSGGIFSSFFSGEGFVLKLEGKGEIKMQTRSVSGLASWLNPKFWR